MAGSQGTNGLCSTCRHFSNCRLRSNATGPVLACAEYEAAPGGRSASRKAAARDNGFTRAVEPDDTKLGLCGTCMWNKACTLRKPEGGVWHCEEFR